MSLVTDGLLDRNRMLAWTAETQKAINSAVRVAMVKGGQDISRAAQDGMRSSLNIKKQSFAKSMKAKIFDADKSRPADLLIGSKVPWLGMHVYGGTITGKMLIPVTEEGKRMGPKAFKAAIDALIKSNNAYFIKSNGKIVLMAANLKANSKELRKFKRAQKMRTGQNAEEGEALPVAVLVTKVVIKARFNLPGIVKSRMPALARGIESELSKV